MKKISTIESRNKYWDCRFKLGQIYGDAPSRIVKKFSQFLPKDGSLLELAGGYGRNAAYLAEKGFRDITSTDVSPRAIMIAQEHYCHQAGLRFEIKDALQLDYEPGRFDAIFSVYGLSIFTQKEMESIFDGCNKLLAIGSRFCTSFLSVRDQEYGIGQNVGRNQFMPDGPQLVRFFAKNDVVQLHRRHGFNIVWIGEIEEIRPIRGSPMVSRSHVAIAEKI